MITKDYSPKVQNRRVLRSELTKYLKHEGYLLKDGQVPYIQLRRVKDEFEWK